jgi:organic anion transporter 4A
VPAGGGGTFLGGYLVKKLKLSCSGTIKLCMVASMFAALFTTCFILSCPNLSFAGVTSSYQLTDYAESKAITSDGNYERYTLPASVHNLESQCNKQCGCSKESYEPICGNDGLLYFSPCFAGCQEERSLDGSKVYLNCNCIINNLVLNHNLTKQQTAPLHNYDGINKMCESKCKYLGLFCVLCFFVMFFTFLATMPALSATLR